ncbi:MAG: 2-oxoacid:ferredoxin oxidoreductase subunit beta [Candidatus Eisenbacteria bacterium]|uniref:2-oxoacid:ferredoxin oxidoreductase subunit beta n=1 Tax=Eiseniibacteriota bacterium TaxID=2212470 RepID=A0A948WBL1_UNCEI|nr:2-oxoacid:ferredoxin oxidoreductase subunit beta [Candidatus Eisenbacteria bacterium]MBU2690068.1 2-oxoacid:ferredoxin oxidoreductase subunit beta [Candidatus Eisenbacteria bacterium]
MTRRDFASAMNPRWCPGCGDYAILNATQTVMAEMGIPRERFVIVSGIGCSSRFPYYMNTYGMHTIHGRGPAVASGLKVARPDLDVWIATGDGDGLSIGGNHLIHILRRNINVNILLFNNRIYGLTKGQYSPTSEFGKKTKSSPMGSPDRPFNPLALALGANATFVARTVDRYMGHMKEVLKAAAEHPGTSFVEILQNCVIFNDGAFEYITENAVREDHDLILEEGKPLIFGKERDKGIRLLKDGLEVVPLGNGTGEEDLMVHDSTREDPSVAMMLAHMEDLPGHTIDRWPVPLGIFRRVKHQTYDAVVHEQLSEAKKNKKVDVQSLLESGDMWEVKA